MENGKYWNMEQGKRIDSYISFVIFFGFNVKISSTLCLTLCQDKSGVIHSLNILSSKIFFHNRKYQIESESALCANQTYSKFFRYKLLFIRLFSYIKGDNAKKKRWDDHKTSQEFRILSPVKICNLGTVWKILILILSLTLNPLAMTLTLTTLTTLAMT